MKKLFFFLFIAHMFFTSNVKGGGISVDAGLTPAENRWILRSQMRFMQRTGDGDAKMNMYHFPLVAAYGLRSDVTVMVRQMIVRRKMKMAMSEFRDSGFGDLFVLGKYKLYRRNTPSYTFGASATLGCELPTGSDDFTSNTWDVSGGLYSSYRRGSLAMDGSAAYTWNGFAKTGETAVVPGNELSLDCAVAYQISIGDHADKALAPVLELSYRNYAANESHGSAVPNSGESVFFVAPGLKVTLSSIFLEGLIWLPVWQDQTGTQLERNLGLLVGMRFMF